MKEIILAHSELTNTIYALIGKDKIDITEQAIAEVKAIKALEQEPCDDMEREYEKAKALFSKVVKSDDCISRQAVLDGLASIAKVKARSDAQKSLMGRIMFFVEQLPPVTPEPKRGHWTHDGSHWKNRFICSECGYKLFEEQTNYCPFCGARMSEVEKDD